MIVAAAVLVLVVPPAGAAESPTLTATEEGSSFGKVRVRLSWNIPTGQRTSAVHYNSAGPRAGETNLRLNDSTVLGPDINATSVTIDLAPGTWWFQVFTGYRSGGPNDGCIATSSGCGSNLVRLTLAGGGATTTTTALAPTTSTTLMPSVRCLWPLATHQCGRMPDGSRPTLTSATLLDGSYLRVTWTAPAGWQSRAIGFDPIPPDFPATDYVPPTGSFTTTKPLPPGTWQIWIFGYAPGLMKADIAIESNVMTVIVPVPSAANPVASPAPKPALKPVPGPRAQPVALESVSNGCGGGEVSNNPRFLDEVTFFGPNPIGDRFKVRFRQACNIHDAGYGGYKITDPLHGNKVVDFRTWTRKQIDGKFRADLKLLCDQQLPKETLAASVAKKSCYAHAEAYYLGVRAAGWKFFDANPDKPGEQYLGPRNPLCKVAGPAC